MSILGSYMFINMYKTGQFLHFFSFLIEMCFVYKSQLMFRNLWFTNQYWNIPDALPASAQLISRSLLPSCGHLLLLQVLGKLSKAAPTMWAVNNMGVMYLIRWHLAVGTQVQSCVTAAAASLHLSFMHSYQTKTRHCGCPFPQTQLICNNYTTWCATAF